MAYTYNLISKACVNDLKIKYDSYAKYGNLIGGVNISGTFAFVGRFAFELGYVVTDKK